MNVVFIFATTEFHKIPQTIVSRCQCFEFNRLTDKQIHDLIVYVNEKEKITIIMVSHDIEAAVKYASHILHLGSEMQFFGTKEEYVKSPVRRYFK